MTPNLILSNRDKRLLDKEKLVEQIENLKLKLCKSEEQVSILNRKLMLESKSAKHKLNFEITKHRQCQKGLDQALVEIDRLTGLLEVIIICIYSIVLLYFYCDVKTVKFPYDEITSPLFMLGLKDWHCGYVTYLVKYLVYFHEAFIHVIERRGLIMSQFTFLSHKKSMVIK